MGEHFTSACRPFVPSEPIATLNERGIEATVRSIKRAADRMMAEAYIDEAGALYLRNGCIRYSQSIPDEWLIGVYLPNVTLCDIEADVRLRCAEIGYEEAAEWAS